MAPIYDYKCGCGKALADWPVGQADKDAQTCPDCGKPMQRQLSLPVILGAVKGYQPAAILSDGRKMPGHFGVTSRKRGRKD